MALLGSKSKTQFGFSFFLVSTIIYLTVATGYALVFILFPTPEMMNIYWQMGFSLVGLFLFLAMLIIVVLRIRSKKIRTAESIMLAGLGIYGVLLAAWIILSGPVSGLSLSTVQIVNNSNITIDQVTASCIGDKEIIRNLDPGAKKMITVIPHNESQLKIEFFADSEMIAKAKIFILEVSGDRIVCEIDSQHKTKISKR